MATSRRSIRKMRQNNFRGCIVDAIGKSPRYDPRWCNEGREGNYESFAGDDLQIRYQILASMLNELQKSRERMKHASDIHMHLEELHSMQTCYESYNTFKELFRPCMVKRSNVHEHCLKMISLIEKLRKLDIIMDNDLYIDLIFQ
ncbi:hypothetical protein CDL12_09138 [Handroanthus impetiginosus]|uniref:Uncharacterized protein n=1 Tax=Handroanthus impetiginosus TaxID=429701 RepID=A0A2G9HL09_9LAMI|nr:hypothetical protein CDL12_09138 [Handroanthus impetiginosus]